MISKLFSPLTIKNITFKNRIVISPMCMYSAINGYATDFHLVHYGSMAIGGAGLIIQEATAISPEGRISDGDLGIYNDKHIEMLQRINSFIHQQGSISAIQLAHAGRKAGFSTPWNGGKLLNENKGGWPTVGPSALPFSETDKTPIALDKIGIKKVISDFKMAALRALKADFKVVEIHAAHGYLIHQFLSPLSNHRTDNYGGSFENRIRLLLEIIKAIKTVWPENLPLFVRISATDWAEGGWSIEESVKLSTLLKAKGIDLIDCSSGGAISNAKIPVAPNYQVHLAQRIKKDANILTGAVGLITEATQAEAILQRNEADLILVARAALRDPHFALNAAKRLGDAIDWPLQYQRAIQ